jgi:predicted  nucleic acid-binding Zn-ribbon protein
LQERSKGLNPRKNTIEKLEKEISETEKAIAATHTTLALTATDNTSKAKESVVSLGMELARLQEKLEGLTSSWETESEALAALEREYDEKLKLFG